jgi:lysophospholipid acyltransferase (LPLAT)-like uncharacterized protein
MLRGRPHDRAPMLRRLIRHPMTQALLVRLAVLYLAFVYRTTRWTLLGEEHVPGVLAGPDGQPRGAIIAFWHERLTMIPMIWIRVRQIAAARGLPGTVGRRVAVLISGHRDGRLISSAVARLGLETVVGSSSDGARAGAMAVLRRVKQNHYVGLTPDGPRGPRRKAAPGVAELAALSGMPIVPLAASSTHAWVSNSWDHMVLPLPFGRGVLVMGAPITVARSGGVAALPMIEAALTAVCDQADAWVAEHRGRRA